MNCLKTHFEFAFVLALILCGCAHNPTSDYQAYQQRQQTIIKQFNNANKILDDGRYAEAAKAYDSITLNDPVGQLDLIIIYNAGLAYYQAGDCKTAGERLRGVVRLAGNMAPPIKYRALMQLADVYTCLGDNAKTITTLIEASGGRQVLPPDIVLAEIPARLAGAYARVGNAREAKRYYQKAERGLDELSATLDRRRDRVPEIAQILIGMGNMQELKPRSLKSEQYLASLRALQKYLFKAVELNVPNSSQAAADQIAQAYDGVWYYIDTDNATTKSDQTQRERMREKLQVAELAVQDLKELYREHIPDPNEPSLVTNFLNQMRTRELKFRNFIATNIVGTNLTPQALRAQSIKRAGYVLNPNPIFEEKAKNK